jgi:predicted transcriptional regulator
MPPRRQTHPPEAPVGSSDQAAVEPMRARILETVDHYPGLHLRELARQLGTSVSLIEYHVPFLHALGHVDIEEDARFRRVYPATMPTADRQAIATLRDPQRLHIVMILLDGPLRHAELAKRARLGKSTLSFHLRRLEEAGLVEPGENYALRSAPHMRSLLQRHRPTPDLMDRFARVWSDIYGN